MSTVRINVGEGYDVMIENGLLGRCGEILSGLLGRCKIAVITDSNVAPLYLDRVTASLENADFSVSSYIFRAGESSKNLKTLGDILEFLAESELTRTDCIVALGGGVTGDMAGFAAGVYLRGIRYVQMPTTLLAAVDSSVGGKTAVDLGAGKNLAGVFIQPQAVLCDVDCLATLTPEIFADGMAEAIKTAVLDGGDFWARFSELDISELITRCVRFKGRIVEADEKETGERKLLNLGHTAAHAVELLSNYTVTHGHAVAIGLAMIARACAAYGKCDGKTACEIVETLKKANLPTQSPYSATQLAAASINDKKRSGDKISLVTVSSIGHCAFEKTDISSLEDIYSKGM